ncbi:S49 family peptidase [Algihabitans albus]|uniref:S49 family peptidase n=1 Tax=Algihabitans albus TaxID=2164067 RepID=UPI001F29814F|nr:S49 family peptidase [Algihabitans albus]
MVAVIRLSGTIGVGSALRRGLSLAELAGPINRAFKQPRLKAVALAINSPGGAAAQSALIAKRIRDLAEEKDVKVYAFCEDVAASGGYWLACAADEIYAQESSLVGSIGVIASAFGFQEAIKKVGVERRLYTAGENKSLLDPFQPARKKDVDRLKRLQGDIHESFKSYVRARRGDRLKGKEEELFSGEIYAGRAAQEVGLIDGLGDLRGILRERYGERVQLRRVDGEKSWLRRRFGLSHSTGAVGGGPALGLADWRPQDLADGALAAVEDRALWSRFGL